MCISTFWEVMIVNSWHQCSLTGRRADICMCKFQISQGISSQANRALQSSVRQECRPPVLEEWCSSEADCWLFLWCSSCTGHKSFMLVTSKIHRFFIVATMVGHAFHTRCKDRARGPVGVSYESNYGAEKAITSYECASSSTTHSHSKWTAIGRAKSTYRLRDTI